MPGMDAARAGNAGREDDVPAKVFVTPTVRQDSDSTSYDAAPFQVMPPLTVDEYAALKADIAERGVLVPVVLDQLGRTIDGHHRRQICAELGIDCPTQVRQVTDDTDARDIAHQLNLARRQLNQEQRRQLIRAELTRNPHRSDRAIGRLLGVDGKTVAAYRQAMAEAAEHQARYAEQERQQREDEDAAHIEQQVQAATTERQLTVWAAWVAAHDEKLALSVLKHRDPPLCRAAAMVCRRFGCRDLGCTHAPPAKEEPDESAEFPQLPTPPLRQMGPYRVHPGRDCWPLISADRWVEFVRDIRKRGLLHPIVLTHDRTTLVDGRIRYLACIAAEIEPSYQTLPENYTEDQIVDYILSTEQRVNLMPGQWAMAGALADRMADGGDPSEAAQIGGG